MNKCQKCGKKVSANHVKLCRKCYISQSKFKVIYCIDCGKQLSLFACYRGDKRCKHCARIYQYATKPETNPFYGLKGKLNPNWQGGKESRKRICIDCGKELNMSACYEGNERCKSCARKEEYKNPKNHPQWLGGISFEPYTIEFNTRLKAFIRERDNHICQYCGKTEEQELKDFNKSLHVHHIDYDKTNCQEENLITLCASCNVKANKDRDYWFAYFSELIRSLLVK